MAERGEVEVRKLAAVEVSVLLGLMRAYCDFYQASPREDRLVALIRTLLDDPGQGVQLLARLDDRAVGFATLLWSWSTLEATRVGIMSDLYVEPSQRGRGVGRALLEACRAACRKRGVPTLVWDTAPDNARAQSLYESTGASSATWRSYELGAW